MDATLTTDDVRRFASELASIAPASNDVERIDRLRLFEELKAALSAEQAQTAADFDRSQRQRTADSTDSPHAVSVQIGLALRMSPARARRWLGWSKILTTELPQTYAQLRAGVTTEWRTTLVARETAVLSRQDRARADTEIAPQLPQLPGFGDRQTEVETRRIAYRLDPRAAVERSRRAVSERRVSVRPAPDTMAYLTALLPVSSAVAAFAALARHADTCTGVGDDRGRGQIMADTLVERITGQTSADAVPVEIELVMTDRTLVGSGPDADEPAELIGYGPIPAGVARELAHGRDGQVAPRWLRRLVTSPDGSELIGMESRRRLFTEAQRKYLRLRDHTCHTPYCDAPIRHSDHVQNHGHGGPTSVANGEGLCEACNYAKQSAAWQAKAGAGGVITIRTPTGHTYTSRAPAPPGGRRPADVTELRAGDLSWPETQVLTWLRAA